MLPHSRPRLVPRSDCVWTHRLHGAHDEGGLPIAEDTAPAVEPSTAGTLRIGARVGRYVVLEEIGRGGMGRVLRAHDPQLQREVALKEVRRDRLGSAGAQRLVAEARAMAKLSHPNVVAVYDVEPIAHGELVLVMEYVPGQTLAHWLQQPHPWRAIVACFRQAGRGLAAAHAAGLLHRDFKADNVLVTAPGVLGEARVRVTDFGLARELDASLDSDPASQSQRGAAQRVAPSDGLTAPGAIVGTLPYLAPERLVGAPADAASDQFAFCVALWEALFRVRPWPGQSIAELAFAMSAGPPRPPSTGPRIPSWLVQTITRGLAHDARDRWPDLPALLVALDRDVAHRRRRTVQIASALGVVAIAAVGMQTYATPRERCSEAAADAHLQGAWDEARRSEVAGAMLGLGAAYADEVWARSEHALDEYASEWRQMHVEACAATTIRGEQAPAVLDLRMACLQRANAELAAVTRVLADADAQTVQRAHAVLATLRPLERCADVEALAAEVEPPLPQDRDAVLRLRAALALATAARKAGHYDEAAQALDTASAELASVSWGPAQAELAVVRGVLLEHTGKYDDAREVLRDGLHSALLWRQDEQVHDAATWLVFVVGSELRHADEAMRYAELARGLGLADPRREAALCTHLAAVLDAEGEYAAAEAEHRRALALIEARDANDPDAARVLGNLANALRSQGRYDEAVAEYQRAIAMQTEALGPRHPDVAGTRHNLAVTLFAQGEHAEAEAEHRGALAVLEPAIGAEHPHVAILRNNLANALFAQREYDDAEAEVRRAIAIQERALGPLHHDVAMSRNSLASILDARGQADAALAEYRNALAIEESASGPDHPDAAQFRHNLALALANRGQYVEAETEHRRALAVLERSLGDEHPHVAASRVNLASLLLQRGETEQARQLAERAWARLQRDDIPPWLEAPGAAVLAQASWASGDAADRGRAIELAEHALATYVEGGTSDGPNADEVRAWLATHRDAKTHVK